MSHRSHVVCFVRVLAVLLPLAGPGCEGEPPGAPEPAQAVAPNFLVVVADDLGAAHVGVYGDPTFEGRTPNLDRLGREGLIFERFWSMPACSSTRASLLTGEYPSRTGIGSAVGRRKEPTQHGPAEPFGLPDTAFTLPRALAGAGYRSAMIGKWHLAAADQGYDHALRLGFDVFRGSFGNLGLSYFAWQKVVDGVLAPCHVYATTDTTDDAIAVAGRLAEPWLIVVSFNAAHAPAHVPPTSLHSYGELDPERQPDVAFQAMVEAMDSEIGRLLAATAEQDPVVLFLGDNGAPGWARKGRRGRGKGSVYEAGVHVPFIVHHSSVAAPGRRVSMLAGVTDVFATLVELSGAEVAPGQMPRDSVSLVPALRSAEAPPVRDWIFTERFVPNGPGPWQRRDRAVRDDRYKLVLRDRDPGRLFDLTHDPSERTPVRDISPTAAETWVQLQRLGDELPPVRTAGP